MRIDLYLSDFGLTKSRSEAKALILEGAVSVNGKVITKPSLDVTADDKVTVAAESKRYVSRGGYKLEGALSAFNCSADGKLALDVGASSGGFTDCLLQNGAREVIAVDSGSGQMAQHLRRDSRVIVKENFNARYMKPTDLEYAPELIVMDVSFISATCIIPAIYEVASHSADFICLVKPQFEVGRGGVGKGGIVKDEKLRISALKKVVDFGASVGFSCLGHCLSPIKDGDGNVEYLVHFKKE